MSSSFPCIDARAQRRDQSLANLCRDLVAHGDQVGGGNRHGVAPQCAIIGNVDGLERDLNLVALLHVVSGDHVGHAHCLARFLQVNRRRVVLAGGGKRADGQ